MGTPRRRAKREYETMEYLALLERLIRRAGVRVADGDEVELAGLLALQETLAAAIQAGVDGQKAQGHSWDWIARAAGTTRSAAFQRWGKRQAG